MSSLPRTVAAPFTVRAPGRVNLIGEHTDYNDGFVLPMAIDRHVAIHVRPRHDRLVILRSGRDPRAVTLDLASAIEPVPRHWSNYPAGVIVGYQRHGYGIPGFDAEISATLPAGGGLSSSAALEVATATAIETLCGRSLPPDEKALLCQQAEHEFAGVPCGIMDQFAVCFGQAGHAIQLDCRSRQIVPVPIDGAVRVLVIDSGVRHSLVDGEYAARRRQCETAARLLGVRSLRDVGPADWARGGPLLPAIERARVGHVLSENDRVIAFAAALGRRDWPAAGRLMRESHESLRRDYEVSCRELDLIVEAAGGVPGVHGCRMTGGGFGGSVVALIDRSRTGAILPAVAESCRAALGREPSMFVTSAAGGPEVRATGG